MLASCEEGIG